jgi:saccharopine dehydrogenase (NAD+, L-lysine-forming)
MKTIAIIREGKTPPDLRTPLTPQQAVALMQAYSNVKVIAQTSPHRCFSDDEYKAVGVEVMEDISHANIFLGVKEVPVKDLIADKTYLFFSHTIKKQAYNRKLLQQILAKNITLVDYETLQWEAGNRIIGFGRFAGIVGAHYALLMWGRKTNTYALKPAYQCVDMKDMYAQYEQLTLPPMKIVLTGDGRVAHGVIEVMKKLKITKVTQEDFLANEYPYPVYVQLRSEDYYVRKDGKEWDKSDFYKHPYEYQSSFEPYTKAADVMINAVFWKAGNDAFFTPQQMKNSNFRIRVISDISCDVPGPLPSTLRSTIITDPFYGYNPYEEKETEAFTKQYIDVQAVGNLPCELPVDASVEFGEQLTRHVLPHLLGSDKEDIIKNATIATGGALTPRFTYLKDYVE